MCPRDLGLRELCSERYLLGKDTDTTACIAGGLAGILYGEQGIPDRWNQELRGRATVESVLSRLSFM